MTLLVIIGLVSGAFFSKPKSKEEIKVTPDQEISREVAKTESK